MSVRNQIITVLTLLAAPAAALAAPASAGEVEAAMRSGAVTPPAVAVNAPAPAPAPASATADEYARRVHELVVGGASYNEAPAEAAARPAPGAASAPAQPNRAEIEQGEGYTPSSYAAAAPTRG